MSKSWSIFFLAWTMAVGAADAPLVLENRHLALSFDSRTGTWRGLTDRRTGDALTIGRLSRATVAPTGPPKLDLMAVNEAISERKAIGLTGEWLYTPKAPSATEAAVFLQNRFDAVKWEATPVPSRRGLGDDRLHNRTGDFWYRREFDCPADWPDEDMALAIGAVDDFDVTYLNGSRIGSTGAETPQHWQTPRLYHFPARLLRRGQPNVLLLKVTNGAFDGGIDGPVVLGLAAALRLQEPDAPLLTAHSFTRKDGAAILRMAARTETYEYQMEYRLPEDRPSFTRQLTVRNIGKVERTFQNAILTTPPLLVGPEQCLAFPGSLPVGDSPVSQLTDGEVIGPRSQEPLVILWDAARQRGLGAWYHCEEEFSPVSARRSGTGAEIRHAQHIVVRLRPGESVTLGRQHFWLAHGSRDTVLRGLQEIYRDIGLRAPSTGLAGLREMTIYCGHPGGPPELGFRTYGGFKALRAYLPTLRKMGIDLLWLLPIWEHGDGKKWNLYSPFDHFRVSSLYGTPEELKQLSADAATNGIRLMLDLVPHGPPDFTPLAKEHPEWICRDESGKSIYAWGQYAFDNHHPGWQDYMRRAADWGAKEFGAIGARVDCGAGGPLNWNPSVGNRPSLSSLAAGLGMNRAIREGYLRANREVVLLPEEYTSVNIFNRVADLTYDAQLYFLMADLQERKAAPEEWARAFQQFFHDQQQTLPSGALKMRWISNHDTVSWTFQKQRPVAAYGVERMRALLAMCALVEGVPMLYQGDDNPAVYGAKGAPSVDFISRLYELRKRLLALREGDANYLSVRATDGVFACLRRANQQEVLVLISFNPGAVETVVALPGDKSNTWTDEFSSERMVGRGEAHIAMQPFQTRVLTMTQ